MKNKYNGFDLVFVAIMIVAGCYLLFTRPLEGAFKEEPQWQEEWVCDEYVNESFWFKLEEGMEFGNVDKDVILIDYQKCTRQHLERSLIE